MKKRNDGRFRTSYTKDGVTKYFYGNTRKEVLKKKEAFKLSSGKTPQLLGKKITFASVSDKWLASKESQVKPVTFQLYKSRVEQLKEQFGKRDIFDVSTEEMQKFLDTKFREGFSRSYLKKHMTILNQIFSYMVLPLKLLTTNPCSILKVSKFAAEGTKRALTLEETNIIFSTFREDMASFQSTATPSEIPFSFYPVFMMLTGLRRSEQVPLEWDDFDLEKETLTISKVSNFEGVKPVVYHFLKNRDEKRVLPIPKVIFNEISLFFNLYANKRVRWIFSIQNELFREDQLRRKWNGYLKRTGLNITQHMLRHTYATMLFSAQVDVKTAQYLMGHKNLETTLKIYTHLQEETLQRSTNLLENYIENRFKIGSELGQRNSYEP